ncbi:MAG: hypothetical protein BRD48_06020 [Bacteroidetes bacterium QS_9_68_14]|nr:MAG: hypothetical protein BRD48_06020 [Bacteroidetes bacterium QS_9_68_14]
MAAFCPPPFPRTRGRRTRGRVAALLPVLLLGGALLLAWPKAEGRAQSTSAGSSEASEAFADALSLYRERLYGAAQEAFADFRDAFPHHARAPEALFYEARASLALENSAAAMRRLEQLQAAYPMHPLAERAQLRLGRYFFEQEANERARRTLRRVLEDAGPERAAEARFLLGRLAQRQGRPADALEQSRTVSQQYPDAAAAPRALYQVASVHLQQGRTAEAADALERLAQRYPAAPQASSLGLALAEVYFDLGRHGDVLRELDQQRGTLEARSERARASFLRAEALRRQGGRRSEAAAAYQRYLERFSESPDARAARYGMALLRYRQADYPRAAALFARVAEAAPDSGHATGTDADVRERAAYLAAVSRAEAGEPGAAAEGFAAFAERFPESPRRPDAQYRRGRALLAAGRPAEAARVLGRVTAEAPDGFEQRAAARYVRSRALQQAGGRDADALAALDEALAAGLPAELAAQARFEQGQLLLRAGRPAEAADAFAAYRRQAPEGERVAEALYRAAEARYRTGAFAEAARGYQRYLREYPEGSYAEAARYGLAWAAFQQENYDRAARRFERFLATPGAEEGTYRSDALLRLGDSYYARRRFAEAERAYARASREGTRDARDYALYQTGQARTRTDDAEGAIAAWQRLVNDFPESELREEARFQIGQARFQAERYDAAVRAWRALLESSNASGALAAKAQYSIGDALYNAGRREAAARAYRAVLEDYPESAFASDAARGVALATGGDGGSDDTLDELGADAAAEVRFRRAETQYQRGQTDAARQAFQEFVRTSTRGDLLPQAYYYLGTIYAEKGEYREAEGYLRQVLREYPDSDRRTDAAGRLGALYLQQDAPQRALDAYEQMQERAPADDDGRVQARAQYGQGRALAALDRPANAEARFREATERAPSGAPVAQEARVARAGLYESTGRPGEAQALYRRVAEESRGAAGAEALYRLGALLLEQDRPEDAIEELRRLPDLFAGFPDWIARSLLIQARAFRAAGRPAQARRTYDRLQDEFAGTEEARTARREQEQL